MENKSLTGYPSIDTPWLKYYSDEAINTPLPDVSMYEYILNANSSNMDCTAIRYFGKKVSYRELFDQIEKTAQAFYSCGIRKGDVVTILSLMTPETIYCVYALNRIGAIANMCYLSLSEQEILDTVKSTNSKMVVALEVIQEKLKHAADKLNTNKILILRITDSMPIPLRLIYRAKHNILPIKNSFYFDDFIKAPKQEATILPNNLSGTEPTIINYTSGTTGKPKGVIHTSTSFNSIAHEYRYGGFVFRHGETILSFMPPFLAIGFGLNIHMPLALGLTLVLFPNPEPQNITKQYLSIKPNHFIAAPSNILQIMSAAQKLKKFDMSFCKTFAGGGESMQLEQEKVLNEFLQEHNSSAFYISGYGMTEFAATVATNTLTAHKEGSLGIPLCLSTVKIVNPDNGQELTYGKVGEICFSTRSQMLRYYNQVEETHNVLKKDENGITWVHTGDLGYVDEEGFVWLKGRIKRIYMSKGAGTLSKIFPARVEELLEQHPQITKAAVAVLEDPERLHIQVAFMVPKSKLFDNNKEAFIKEVDTYCKKYLPEHEIPVRYEIIDDIPLTQSGKVDYRALEKQAQEQETSQ